MSDGRYGEARQALSASVAQAKELARAAYAIAAKDAMAWDEFRWAVVALLAANLLLSLILYLGIRSDIAALKQDRDAYAHQLADLRVEVGKEIAETKTGLTQALTAMQSGLADQIAKTNARLSRSTAQAAPKPLVASKPPPVPKPTRKPHH
jgi:hypothetical protein